MANYFTNNQIRMTKRRSVWPMPHTHKTSFNFGELVPIYRAEVLAADTWKIDLKSVVRMATPIAPIMDDIYLDVFAFFVPFRLVWEHWEEMFGENKNGPWAQTTVYEVPNTSWANTFPKGTLGSYLITSSGKNSLYQLGVSVLYGRAYGLIWSEWFRDQNTTDPFILNISDTSGMGTIGGSPFSYQSPLLKSCKYKDYFTAALPAPLKAASPVTIPLGQFAPVITQDSGTSAIGINSLTGKISGTGYGTNEIYALSGQSQGEQETSVLFDKSHSLGTPGTTPKTISNFNLNTKGKLVADLSNAAAASIASLRSAISVQALYERDARSGTRYISYLKAAFGVMDPTAVRLTRPELLGSMHVHINVDQVLQQAGYNGSTDTTLGTAGAYSHTYSDKSLVTKSFTEPGILMILATTRSAQTYCQGIERMFTRKNRFDFYDPIFANLGEQPIYNYEIYADGTAAAKNVFGYAEAWADYRFMPNRATGLLDPNVSNSLSYWTLANRFAARPTLSQSFVENSRIPLEGALTTGETGPDFIADFFFDTTVARIMPMYSVPAISPYL